MPIRPSLSLSLSLSPPLLSLALTSPPTYFYDYYYYYYSYTALKTTVPVWSFILVRTCSSVFPVLLCASACLSLSLPLSLPRARTHTRTHPHHLPSHTPLLPLLPQAIIYRLEPFRWATLSSITALVCGLALAVEFRADGSLTGVVRVYIDMSVSPNNSTILRSLTPSIPIYVYTTGAGALRKSKRGNALGE